MKLRPALKLLVACSLLLGVLALSTAPAGAHAVLSSTQPASGARLAESPKNVTLEFSEPVQIPAGSVEIFNEKSDRINTGKPQHPNGNTLAVEVPIDGLPVGGYVVSWRVVSVDAHPITGAFTFQIGDGSINTDALSKQVSAGSSGSTLVGTIYAVDRSVLFASLMVAIGALAFLVAFGLDAQTAARARRLFYFSSATLAIATVFAFFLQGIYGAGLPLRRVFDGEVVSDTLSTRLGISAVVRLAIVAVLVAVVRFVGAHKLVALLGSLALVITISTSGHATTGRWIPFAFVADVLHVAAAAAWIGGLVVLMVVVFRTKDGAQQIITWFSALAFWCVVVMIVTGSFQGLRQLQSLNALWTSDYGVIFLVKLAVFIGLLAAANISRSWVKRNGGGVRRSVAIEIVLAVAVIGVTSILVNSPPAKAAAPREPVSAEVRVKDSLVDVAIDPARVGSNSLSFYVLDLDGKLKEVPELTAILTNTGKNVGPLTPPLQKVRAGHYASPGFVFPVAGEWKIDLTVRTSEFDQATESVTVRIR